MFKEVFNLTNKYIILATPLIIYSLIANTYLILSFGSQRVSIIFTLLVFVLMSIAFASGWFNMVKLAVTDSLDETCLGKFPAGVGEYFLPVMGMTFVCFVYIAIVFSASYYVGMKFIGNIGINQSDFINAMASTEAIKTFLASLTQEQLMKLNLWNMFLMAIMSAVYFSLIFYIPALFFKEKNPLKALWTAFKDLFNRKIFKSLLLFLTIFAIYFVISIIMAVSAKATLINFIMTLVNFYFVTAASVGVFYFYYNNFVKPQIGTNVDIEI